MALSKEEKIQLLQQQIKKAKKKLEVINRKEALQKRKERARKLIELGAFFFGNEYENIYDWLKKDKEKAEYLKNKLNGFLSDKKEK